MTGKRKLKRRHLIYYLNVYDTNTDRLLGQLVDITTEGMMLTSDDPIEENVFFELRMVLPEAIEAKEEILFDARSLYCRQDVNPDLYSTGFKFENISENDQKIIENLINEYSFHN
jgi:c-di-GMP-binding flagellar brake protein YcgR